MKFHVITLFPEVVECYLKKAGVVARAVNDGLIEFETYFLRDYSEDKHKRVDEVPFGGGVGMVIKCEPLFNVVEKIFGEVGKCSVVNFAPRVEIWDQEKASEWSIKEDKDIILICGRYEGIDQRVIDELVTHEFSIGEQILSGGELPALIFIESITRLIPGVLGNNESPFDKERSYPVYTRPENFKNLKVPSVLLSGDHAKVEEWRKKNGK